MATDFGQLFGSFVEGARTAADLRDQNYKYQQQRAIGRALRGSIDPATGKPVEGRFREIVEREGVDIDPYSEFGKRLAGGAATAQQIAAAGKGTSALGGNIGYLMPDSKAGVQFQEPKDAASLFGVGTQSESKNSEPLRYEPTSKYDFLTSPSAPQAEPTGTTDVAAGKVGAEAENVVRVPGKEPAPSNLPEQRLDMIDRIPYAPDRTYKQDQAWTAFANNLDTSIPQVGAMPGAGGSAAAAGGIEDLLKWAPRNEGGNVYTQYGTALAQKMAAVGASNPQEYLRNVYETTLRSNTPTAPNPMAFAGGAEGLQKYGEQMQQYTAGLAQAEGKARQAVISELQSIPEFAKQFGGNVVEQRKTELPQGMTLRDPAKRNEAAALISNRDNITNALEGIMQAGTNTTALSMVAPQVIRAYATSLNPGQQLSEGNLAEVGAVLFPEAAHDKGMLAQAVVALARGMKTGNWDMLDRIGNFLDAGNADAIRQRLLRVTEEARNLNETSLSSYVIGAEPPEPPAPRSRKDVAESGAREAFGVKAAPKAAKPASRPLAGVTF